MTGSPESPSGSGATSPGSAVPCGPALWSVAGGKGGVGRSLLVANMGIQLARMGKKVTVADLDFQGTNLHAYLGFERPAKGLESLADTGDVPLSSLLLDTSVSGLKLLAGASPLLSTAQRTVLIERLLAQAATLPSEILIVDCGSGRSAEVLDLFRAGSYGVLVGSPEPAAAESIYLFAESLLARILEFRLSPAEAEKLEIARRVDEQEPDGRASFRSALERLRREGEDALADRIRDSILPLRLRLILNQIRGESDGEIASLLVSGFDKFFGLGLTSLGPVEFDLSVIQSIQKRKPLSQQYPNSPATQGIERAISALIHPPARPEAGPMPLTANLVDGDYYRLLEVSPGASSREIQLSYQNLLRAYGPESMFRHPLLSAAQMERIASLLEVAYRTLIFLETRTEYDRKLLAEGILRPDQMRSTEGEGAGSIPARPAPPVAAGEAGVTPLPVTASDTAAPPLIPAASTPDGRIPGQGLPVTGATLREHREARKMAVEAIVERTKIRPAILAALEEDRFTDLPEPVFLKGFLRQLALCLGLDPAVVCREYMARMTPPTSPESK